MFRRSASSLLLAGLLFADGSWLGRLELLFRGFLGGEAPTQAAWAASEWGASIDPNGQPRADGRDTASGGGSSAAERGVTIDPNG
jgi:hypothetical protein